MLLTIKELSQYLQIKPATLYAWAAQSKIPHFKIQRLIRFRKEEIDTWLEGFRMEDHKTPSPSLPSMKAKDPRNIDDIIARVKGEVLNASHRGTRPK